MSGRDDLPDELTEARLDALLDTAGADLLRHLEATSTIGSLLSAFLSADRTALENLVNRPAEPSAMHARAVIALRAFDRVRDRAVTLAHALACDVHLARDCARARAGSLARALDFDVDLALARDLDFTLALDFALDLDYRLTRALDLACDLNRYLHFDPVGDLDHHLALGLDHRLARALDRARGHNRYRARVFAGALDRDLARTRDHALNANLSRALDLARDLYRVQGGQSWARLRELAMGQVDASGADLRQADVTDLSVLSNVIWSDDTLWPSGTKQRIRAHSRELRPGVYLVQGGDERENVNVT